MRACARARAHFLGCACPRHEYLEDRARAVVEHAELVGSAGGPRPRQRLVEGGPAAVGQQTAVLLDGAGRAQADANCRRSSGLC